jgi:hypothetical protein
MHNAHTAEGDIEWSDTTLLGVWRILYPLQPLMTSHPKVPNNLSGYVRVSIRERFVAPAEKEKARIKGRDTFNPSASLSLKEHCLLGWETVRRAPLYLSHFRLLFFSCLHRLFARSLWIHQCCAMAEVFLRRCLTGPSGVLPLLSCLSGLPNFAPALIKPCTMTSLAAVLLGQALVDATETVA